MKIDVMTKDKDIKTVVPALRFPEFRDGEGWKIVSLGEVCDVVGGGTPDTKEDSYWNGDILWLTPSEVGNRFISDSCRKITLSGLKNSSAKLLPAGSIVLTTRATLGEMSILVTEASTNQGFQSLVPKLGTNKDYIYYLQPIIKEQCLRFSKGSTFLEVSSTSVKNFKIPFTSNKEQEKVADCLGSMDDLISSVADKIETLKEYKKGLMQQLFPAEGKTTPILRFPEFQNEREWKKTILESLCNSIASGKNKNNPDGNYNLYGSTGIIGKTDTGDYNGTYILVARVGTHAGFLTKVDGKFGVTDNTLVINLKLKGNIDFVYYLLYNKGLNNLVFGSGQPLITGSLLKNLEIAIPSSIEQQKIADSLSSVDELISTETAKLDQLKAHKKGLMQQLFPKLQ